MISFTLHSMESLAKRFPWVTIKEAEQDIKDRRKSCIYSSAFKTFTVNWRIWRYVITPEWFVKTVMKKVKDDNKCLARKNRKLQQYKKPTQNQKALFRKTIFEMKASYNNEAESTTWYLNNLRKEYKDWWFYKIPDIWNVKKPVDVIWSINWNTIAIEFKFFNKEWDISFQDIKSKLEWQQMLTLNAIWDWSYVIWYNKFNNKFYSYSYKTWIQKTLV